MIRQRMFGNDVSFMAWLRQQEEQLPSVSFDCSIVADDVDCIIHRYLTCVDTVGTRDIQGLIQIEVKTRGGGVQPHQLDTLSKVHACSFCQYNFQGQIIRNFGVAFLFLSGTNPDDSSKIEWGRFKRNSSVVVRNLITKDQLFGLLRFDLHADNLASQPFRRHHKTQEFIRTVKAPLGFEYEMKITKRS